MFFRIMGRLTVRFFQWLGRVFLGIGRSFGRHFLATSISLLLLVVVGVTLYQTSVFGFLSTSDSVNIDVPQVDALSGQAGPAPSEASKELITGLYKQDGQKVWDSLSDRYKNSLAAQNIDSKAIQKLIDDQISSLKKDGYDLKYVKTQMQGETDLASGSTLEVYTNYYRLGDRLGNADINVVLDKNHKVDVVQTPSDHPEPLISAIFSGGKAQANTDAQGAAASTTPQAAEGQYSKDAAAAAEDFMAGITNFDANRLWNSLSPSYQKQLTDQKITKDTIQKTFDTYRSEFEKRKQPLSYQGYALQETINLTGQRTLSKYESVLTYNGSVRSLQYEIFVDSTGKITNIGIEDPILQDALGIKSQNTTTGN